MGAPIKQLPVVNVYKDFYTKIEKIIKRAFRDELYEPLITDLALPKNTIKNSPQDLIDAINRGVLTFYHGRFKGKLNATLTKELRKIGAVWDRRTATYKIRFDQLPTYLVTPIRSSDHRFQKKMEQIDKRLQQFLPAKITDKVKISNLFDGALWKLDKDINKTLENITVMPELTKSQRKTIADEWQNNMDLWIKKFTEKEIVKLRKAMQATILKGNRYENMIKEIQKSYGVTQNKAKFLARQETRLLLTKFKEVRYTDSGITEYKWGCVSGTPAHPVRPAHKKLEGQIIKMDNPPITSEPGQPVRRNHAGADYNCRCFMVPIVRFKK